MKYFGIVFLALFLCVSSVRSQTTTLPANIATGTPGQPARYTATTAIASTANNYFYADQYSGADASVKINACITAVIALGGGTCDASAFYGYQLMSTQINVGGGSGNLITANGNLTLILPLQAVWNWNITNGTSCGIMQYTNTSIIGQSAGGDYAGTQLGANSGATSMDSLYCTQPSPTELGSNLSNVRAEGFLAANYNGGTFANGVIHIQSVSDESLFSRIGGLNYTGDSWIVENFCCATHIDSSFGDSGQPGVQTGGNVLTIRGGGNGGNNLIISNSTFNGPGVGKYNVYYNPSANNFGVNFLNDYFEKYGANGADAATPMIYIGANTIGTQFIGGLIVNNCTSSCAEYAFENHSTYEWFIENLNYGYYALNAVNDIAGGRTWTTSPSFMVNAGNGTVNEVPMSFGNGRVTSNISEGPGALAGVTSGATDIAIGTNAGATVSTQNELTAVGYETCQYCAAYNETAFGYLAMGGSTGTHVTGAADTAVGSTAGEFLGSGNYNTAIGYAALLGVTGTPVTGANNTAIGANALTALITTGAGNTGVGEEAGSTITTGTDNVMLGYFAQPAAASDTNEIAIGWAVTGAGSNTTTIGNSSTTSTRLWGSINLASGHLLYSPTAPTIATHFNTSGDSISANNGTAAFTITVGTGGAGSTGAITLPTATTGWNCWVNNINRADLVQQTGGTNASATFTNYGLTIGTPVNWTNSDVLHVSCFAY